MTLLAATGESVTVKDMLIAFAVIGPIYTAIAWYSIRKTLASTARYSRDGLIAKWVGAFLVSAFILVASAYAGGGFALIGVLLAVLVPGSIILPIILTPFVSNLMASPITNAMEGRLDEHWEKPAYGPVITPRNRGDYQGALTAVEALLEKHPGDFEGQMLKASIQAEDFRDLDAAKQTLNEILAEDERLRFNLPVVYNKLADWHLNLFDDPDEARRALKKISEAYPDTKAAQLAAQRLASMDSFDAASDEATDVDETFQEITTEAEKNNTLKGPLSIPTASDEDLALANETALARCIDRVEEHPNSIINREELADLYFKHSNQPELAVFQYEYLIGMPGATEKQQVAWLNKVADIQVKSGCTQDVAKETLQRIVDLNEDGAGATRAKSRMMHLAIELRAANKKNTPLKLERREEDLGLM